MIKLQLRDQPQRFVSLAGAAVTLGRDEGNDFPIDDPSISDFHAEIRADADGLEIVDLLSARGTFVNDRRVRQRRRLHAWDVVRLGNVELEVNDPTVNRPDGWALRSESDLLAGQFYPLAAATVAGRGVECDLRIDDATLSRRHAELTVHGGVLHVRDLGSANGVFVNDARVDDAELSAGDRLRLGSRAFLVVGPERRAGSDVDPTDATIIQGGGRAAGDTEVLDSVGPACLVEQTGFLGGAAELPLQGGHYRLGRNADNDVVIADGSISRLHAMLSPVAGGWRVQDMHSSNGVLVNGERVAARELKDGDEIRLGRAVFVFRSGVNREAAPPRQSS